jgi:hypothetical protein
MVVAVVPFASVTMTVNVLPAGAFAVFGVPVIAPVELRDRPSGSGLLPDARAYL